MIFIIIEVNSKNFKQRPIQLVPLNARCSISFILLFHQKHTFPVSQSVPSIGGSSLVLHSFSLSTLHHNPVQMTCWKPNTRITTKSMLCKTFCMQSTKVVMKLTVWCYWSILKDRSNMHKTQSAQIVLKAFTNHTALGLPSPHCSYHSNDCCYLTSFL